MNLIRKFIDKHLYFACLGLVIWIYLIIPMVLFIWFVLRNIFILCKLQSSHHFYYFTSIDCFQEINLKNIFFESFKIGIMQNFSIKLSFIFKARYLKRMSIWILNHWYHIAYYLFYISLLYFFIKREECFVSNLFYIVMSLSLYLLR